MSSKGYKEYYSTHARERYGPITIRKIEKEFSTWDAYFGKFLPREKNAPILDLGCGSGGFVYWLTQRGYKNVTGVDISKDQVSTAHVLNIKNIVQADAAEFLEKEKSNYSLIFARDLLEHIPKEKLVPTVKLIHESLKEKGAFIAQTVNAESPLWGRLRHGDLTHTMAFTHSSANQLMRLAGFDKIDIHPQRPPIKGTTSLVRHLLWRGTETCLRAYLALAAGSPKGIFTQNLLIVAEK
jgi:2-polyprenyl-3-methyl-5-hydroxy-6-metoxy-1,4-benzoquinol methylase